MQTCLTIDDQDDCNVRSSENVACKPSISDHKPARKVLAIASQKFYPKDSALMFAMRCRSTLLQQIMGNLPMERVSPALPFVRTGVDLYVTIAYRYLHRKLQPLKGYVVIFVCMVVKAVHIDLVTDLTTDDFIAALRRFVARSGKPSLIECDNAKHFVGATK